MCAHCACTWPLCRMRRRACKDGAVGAMVCLVGASGPPAHCLHLASVQGAEQCLQARQTDRLASCASRRAEPASKLAPPIPSKVIDTMAQGTH